MPASKITYGDKSQAQVSGFPANQTNSFNDANELKTVVNAHADDIDTINAGAIINPVATIDFAPAAAPTYQRGRFFYDSVRETFSGYNAQADITINFSEEMLIHVYNNSGATILNGAPVNYALSVVGGLPTIKLAIADTVDNGSVSGVATHDIEDATSGYITAIGSVGDLDTSAFALGAQLNLSGTVAGTLVDVEQQVNSPVAIVLVSDAVNGIIFVRPRGVVDVTAVGQVAISSIGVTQSITTTPTPVAAYGNVGLPLRNMNAIFTAGSGQFEAQLQPLTVGASGFYRGTFNSSMLSSSNQVLVFTIYVNGSPTAANARVDFSNNQTDEGSVSINAITTSTVTNTDIVEVYVETVSGTTTLTYQSCVFGMDRIGQV